MYQTHSADIPQSYINSFRYQPFLTEAQLKQNPRFWECYTCFALETKTVRILVFFNKDVCSGTLMESSRRNFLNDMVDRRPISKKTKLCITPVLVSQPKQVQHSQKREFCFHCTVHEKTRCFGIEWGLRQ